jgi:NTE family protein
MNKEYGLVFAGGGTKGAYQVGVAKALKEMHIKIKGVTGASIGSINGALFAQDTIPLMEELYANIEMTDILKVSEDNALDPNQNLFSFQNAIKLGGEYLKDKGISNEPLANMLKKYININKLYRSRIDFGIITYDEKTSQGVELFKHDIPKDEMYKYLLASSCFPIFKPQKIGDNSYLDGGLADNMPVNMLIKKGYKNIILIDVTGMGMIRKNIDPSVYVKVIAPDEDLGGTFNFNHDNIEKNIKLGYFDTLKAFQKVHGMHFYFKNIEYYKMLDNFTTIEFMGLEEAGMIYKLDRYRYYKAQEFLDAIMVNYDKEEKAYNEIKNEKITIEIVKKALNQGMGVAIAMDIITNYPTLANNQLVLSVLGSYIKAASSIQAIRNTKRISPFWY